MKTQIITYDIEVFAFNFLVACINHNTKKVDVFTDGIRFRSFLEDNYRNIFCGFNNKNYDKFVAAAIVNTNDPVVVKDVNDFIIRGNRGWDYEDFNIINYRFDQFDLMDDMTIGQSLKSIEGHLGLDIRECKVPFDIKRPLTEEELEEVKNYCIADITATDKILELRIPYLETKINLGEKIGLSEKESMALTNAQLTAKYLGANKQAWSDEREYKYPENLLKEYIPQEIFDFFNAMYDPSILDEDLFKRKLELEIGGCPTTVGWGGCHASLDHYREKATEQRVIRNVDVASYYPHLITLDGYASRNMENPRAYEDVLNERMEAKKNKDKRKANDLKLIVNTTYGATLAPFNDLYDPLMARSVCITGQLRLIELAEHLYKEVPSLKIIQINTDGIMVSLDLNYEETYLEICEEWQNRTGFELEEDDIAEIVQKDVNNYIEVGKDGKRKIKGGTLVRGIGEAGAFKVNNNATIVSTALLEYFTHDTPVEQTIGDCDDLFQFQLIAKASGKYSMVYQLVGDKKVEVQRCNRVYASPDKNLGTLYKVHRETGSPAKVAGLPAHCLIDNSNTATIDQIDKGFYVRMAKRYVNDFKGISNKADRKKIKSLEKDALSILS